MPEYEIWIPEDKRTIGSQILINEDTFEVWEVVDELIGNCNACGDRGIFLISRCVASTKSLIAEYSSSMADEIGGSRIGDEDACCLTCGSCETGSRPFGILSLESGTM